MYFNVAKDDVTTGYRDERGSRFSIPAHPESKRAQDEATPAKTTTTERYGWYEEGLDDNS